MLSSRMPRRVTLKNVGEHRKEEEALTSSRIAWPSLEWASSNPKEV